MKNVMTVMTLIGVTVLLVIPSFAVAAKAPKPDKDICYMMAPGGDYFDNDVMLLGAKKSGVKGKDMDTKIDFYNYIGVIYNSDYPGENAPFSGSTYYNYQSDGIHYGQISGFSLGAAFQCQLYLYPEMPEFDRALCSYNGAPWVNYPLTEVDCGDYDFDASTMVPLSPQTSNSEFDPRFGSSAN